ncbi:MAG: VCBS repeat-containing protein [Bacteroidetes bacterium]|nr:VCBS repeat-containing protein [Bacteroidota bacterium]
MARNLSPLILLLLFLSTAAAQQFRSSPHVFGTNIAAGGIDQPRFQFTDIDADGGLDLFILDRDGYLSYFRSVNGTLTLQPSLPAGLTAGSWFRFVDIDSDGDQDMFTSGPFSEVSLYTNTGSPASPVFQLTAAALKDTSGSELFSERFSVPTFADIDGDGDQDFFTGSSIGSVTFYRNIGTPSSPQFTFITSEFGGINIQGGPTAPARAMHGASSIEFFDADSNGVLDLFWGDYFNRSLYFLKNSGTPAVPNIALTDSTYPNEAVILTNGFNIPQHVDVDGDGLTDLMIGSVFPTSEIDNLQFLRNMGTNQQPFYILQTKNYIPMIDAGSRSSVAPVDADGDGDRDLVIAAAAGTVSVYRNIGSAAAPLFPPQPALTFSLAGDFYLTVTSRDLDGDGKADLLFGNFNGRLKAFRNTGSGSTLSFQPMAYVLDAYDAGQNSAPCFADPDNDGDNDLFIGNSGGTVQFFRNTGTNALPVFVADTSFHAPDVGTDAIPGTADIDLDGSLDLFIGNSDGAVWHLEQQTAGSSSFALRSAAFNGFQLNTQASPSFHDMDGDGDPDLLLGNGKGGLLYYINDQIVSADRSNTVVPVSLQLSNVYPNPFNPAAAVTLQLHDAAEIDIIIIDIAGRIVTRLADGPFPSGTHHFRWDATNTASGAYLLRCTARFPDRSVTEYRRMSLIK